MMIIVQSKVKQGKTTELIRRFCEDEYPASLLSDELNLYEIRDIIKRENFTINNKETKRIFYVNIDKDNYEDIIRSCHSESVYLDIRSSKDKKYNVQDIFTNLEKQYAISITMTEQLPANSKDGINILHKIW